jgi:hypothetical protein
LERGWKKAGYINKAWKLLKLLLFPDLGLKQYAYKLLDHVRLAGCSCQQAPLELHVFIGA